MYACIYIYNKNKTLISKRVKFLFLTNFWRLNKISKSVKSINQLNCSIYIWYIGYILFIDHWSFSSAYCCEDSSGMAYCLKYLMEIYGFIEIRWLFKPLVCETFCDLPIWYVTFVFSHTTYPYYFFCKLWGTTVLDFWLGNTEEG